MDKVQKIREEVEKQLNLLERVAEKLKNGLITSGNVSHTSKVQGYTIENVVNNIKEILQKEHVSNDLEKENKIEILADIIFNAAKHGYIPYNTQDEYCAMEIAKKNIGKFITQ